MAKKIGAVFYMLHIWINQYIKWKLKDICLHTFIKVERNLLKCLMIKKIAKLYAVDILKHSVRTSQSGNFNNDKSLLIIQKNEESILSLVFIICVNIKN